MANLAAEARAKILAAHPEAVVVERRRNSIKHRLADAPDGRRRYACDYRLDTLPPIAGGAPDDQIDASSDDAYEVESSGTMYLTAVYVRASSGAADTGRRWGGLRFHNGPFPGVGATIDVAHITVDIISTDNDDANLDIYAEYAAGPLTFTVAASDITDRTLTAASAAWVADAIGAGWAQSPSIVAAIQEVVDDFTPTAIVIVLKPRTNITKELRFSSWDEASHILGATLHLEWTGGAAAARRIFIG